MIKNGGVGQEWTRVGACLVLVCDRIEILQGLDGVIGNSSDTVAEMLDRQLEEGGIDMPKTSGAVIGQESVS